MNNLKRWLSPSELAAEFGFKLSTQQDLRKRKKIPYSKVGNKFIFYDRVLIDKWLASHAITS